VIRSPVASRYRTLSSSVPVGDLPVSGRIQATLYTDPGCPWAYSAIPALRVIEWRYGPQLDWRLVMIGLSEDTSRYVERGFTPLRSTLGQLSFRRYGMPFSLQVKGQLSATGRACRAVIAAGQHVAGAEWPALRALQLANFTSTLALDDGVQLRAVLATVRGLDADRVIASIDSPEVTEAYERDKAEARTAAGSAAELQGKTAGSDGPVRFTAPSVTFGLDETRLVAGGWQPVEAYDVLIANLDPTLERRPPPESPLPLLDAFPEGLTTQEVALLMTRGNDLPDRIGAERLLLQAVAENRLQREQLGDDALWILPRRSS
jgi:2-hydroxychromene-2-carboxylate isomerase